MREVIRDGSNGLLADFFDTDGLADKAVAVLNEPAGFRHLGEQGAALVRERYALDVTLPRLIQWFERSEAGNLA